MGYRAIQITENSLHCLDVCLNGANKTKIVYQANLNFRTINPYLDLLIGKNLIKVSQGQILRYETTPQGIDMLEDIKEVHNGLLC
ncbi:MAG: winged helix-turn-helix domain-containing protein [Methanotrichaceae archaeon]|jgi:predicted transcriptional regulator